MAPLKRLSKRRVGEGAKRRARGLVSAPRTVWASLRSAHPTLGTTPGRPGRRHGRCRIYGDTLLFPQLIPRFNRPLRLVSPASAGPGQPYPVTSRGGRRRKIFSARRFLGVTIVLTNVTDMDTLHLSKLAHRRAHSGCDLEGEASAVPAGGLANRPRAASGHRPTGTTTGLRGARWTETGETG